MPEFLSAFHIALSQATKDAIFITALIVMAFDMGLICGFSCER